MACHQAAMHLELKRNSLIPRLANEGRKKAKPEPVADRTEEDQRLREG